MTFLPNSTFYRLMRGFHRTFVTDVYSSGHLVPSHLGLAYVLLVETNPFPKLVVIFSGLFTPNIPGYFLDFLSMYLLLRMNDMLDIFYMGLVQLSGARNKQNLQNEKFLSKVEFEPMPGSPILPVHRLIHVARS